MKVIAARNVHSAFPMALAYLDKAGVSRNSRNGPVIVSPEPVTTVYQRPQERVIFWPERDANPFLHLAEAIWMLDGRQDLDFLTRYTKQYAEYSDDGRTLHDAYGYRWREYFDRDQVRYATHALSANPDDRRVVIQMWDPEGDLGREGKAVPCNLTLTFQINHLGQLDMVVFCRSNDIVWGAYGANVVTFSVLQEYLAGQLERPVGTYSQVSVNWHAYPKTYDKLADIHRDSHEDPYRDGQAMVLPMGFVSREDIHILLSEVDGGFKNPSRFLLHPWTKMAYVVLHAHDIWKTHVGVERYDLALEVLRSNPQHQQLDWNVAAREWLLRRRQAFLKTTGQLAELL